MFPPKSEQIATIMIHISTISPTKRQKRFHLCTSQRFSKMKHFKQKNKAESVPFFLLITNQDAIFAHSPSLKTAQSHNCSILITSKFNNSVTKKVEPTIQYLVSAHPHPNHNRFQPGKYPKKRTKTREFADAVTESRSAASGGCRLSPSQLPSPEILPSPAAKI